jgi:hypothetical protein
MKNKAKTPKNRKKASKGTFIKRTWVHKTPAIIDTKSQAPSKYLSENAPKPK